MKKILEGESAGRCLEERMRESEAGGRVVVQGVVSSGSCRFLLLGRRLEIFLGGEELLLGLFGGIGGQSASLPEGTESLREGIIILRLL